MSGNFYANFTSKREAAALIEGEGVACSRAALWACMPLGRPAGRYPAARKEQRAMKRIFLEFWRDESGTAAIEYGIIAAMVSVPLVHSAQVVTVAINATFEKIIDAMN